MGIDVSAWTVAITTVTWLRYVLEATPVDVARFFWFMLAVLAVAPAAGSLACLYEERYPVGGLEEAVRLAWVALAVGALGAAVDLSLAVSLVPRAITLTAAFVALSVSLATRAAIRWSQEHWTRSELACARRVIVFGAGAIGRQVIRSMLRNPASGHRPVAVLDDDLPKQSIRRIPVLGTRRDIAEVAARTGATLLVVAVRDLPVDVLLDVSRAAHESGLAVQVGVALDDLGPWEGECGQREPDVPGSGVTRQADPIPDARDHIAGKQVLVTGAGGVVGAELCRRIHRLGAAQLFLLDRDDSALRETWLSIEGDSAQVVPADIGDSEAVRAVLAHCLPDVVFHAASDRDEPWKINVLGTYYVLEAALSAGVRTFVTVSADEAANPVDILGCSHRVGERLTAHAASRTDGKYLSVRIGDVLGSRDAARLVIGAAATGRSGQALLVDVGERLSSARQLVAVAGRSAPTVYTALSDTVHEELLEPLDTVLSRVPVPALDPAYLLSLALGGNEVTAVTECAMAPDVSVTS